MKTFILAPSSPQSVGAPDRQSDRQTDGWSEGEMGDEQQ